MIFEGIINRISNGIGIQEPTIREEPRLDNIMRRLGNNLDGSFFYKNYTWGDNGNPGYINHYYPHILRIIIQKLKEDTLMIVTRDDDGLSQSDLIHRMSEKTIDTITNKDRFKNLPTYHISAPEKICIQKANDTKRLNVNFNIIPENLEMQAARAIISNDNLKISDTGKTGHDLLREIGKRRDLGEGEQELMQYSIDYLLEGEWIKPLSSLIESYFKRRMDAH
ncbi:MAG: hypothetical protein ACTSUE_06735 [Promethearchaeota archaeon]